MLCSDATGEQYLCTAIADGQLPSGHASRREGGNLVGVVDATHSNDIVLVSRVVEGAVEGAIVAYC